MQHFNTQQQGYAARIVVDTQGPSTGDVALIGIVSILVFLGARHAYAKINELVGSVRRRNAHRETMDTISTLFQSLERFSKTVINCSKAADIIVNGGPSRSTSTTTTSSTRVIEKAPIFDEGAIRAIGEIIPLVVAQLALHGNSPFPQCDHSRSGATTPAPSSTSPTAPSANVASAIGALASKAAAVTAKDGASDTTEIDTDDAAL